MSAKANYQPPFTIPSEILNLVMAEEKPNLLSGMS